MSHSLTAHVGAELIKLGSTLSENPTLVEAIASRKCFTDDSGSTRIVLPSYLCVHIDADQRVELIEASPPVHLFDPSGTPIVLDPKSLVSSFPEAVIGENGNAITIHSLDVGILLAYPIHQSTAEDIEVVSIGRIGYFDFVQ
jgi:stage V sporulation protein SpoVS